MNKKKYLLTLICIILTCLASAAFTQGSLARTIKNMNGNVKTSSSATLAFTGNLAPDNTNSYVYTGGSILLVNWTSVGNISYVNMGLYDLSNNSVSSVTGNGGTPNNGTFYWLIPTSVISGAEYKLRIEDLNEANISSYSNKFEIWYPYSSSQQIILDIVLLVIAVGIIGIIVLLIKKSGRKAT